MVHLIPASLNICIKNDDPYSQLSFCLEITSQFSFSNQQPTITHIHIFIDITRILFLLIGVILN